jgi:hypothetical protein
MSEAAAPVQVRSCIIAPGKIWMLIETALRCVDREGLPEAGGY